MKNTPRRGRGSSHRRRLRGGTELKVALAVAGGCALSAFAVSTLAGPGGLSTHRLRQAGFLRELRHRHAHALYPRPKARRQLHLDPDAAAAVEAGAAKAVNADLQPSDPDRGPPEKGADVGAYNFYWMDPGTTMSKIDGKYRTSIIVDPPNGRLPEISDAGKARRATLKQKGWFQNTGTAWWMATGAKPYDDMETQPLVDRCLYLDIVTVPIRPIVYNNLKTIVQTEDQVMILVEWMHWARIVRLNSEHLPDDMRSLAGACHRPVGRRHAGRRDHQFPTRTRRATRRTARGRTVLAARRKPSALPVHGARSGLRRALHRRVPVAEDGFKPVRICRPRGQLCDGQYVARCASVGEGVDGEQGNHCLRCH